MAKSLMFLGTHSNAGKSLMTAACCLIFKRRGYRVAPFKSQNMSNNAGVTPAGGEMGRAQIVQAEAAGIAPHTDMNPVLLKPQADRRSQIVLNGAFYGYIDAVNWRDIKRLLWDEVRAAYDRLASRYDIILLEGAGSPAEINLKDADIVNLPMAKHAAAPCILVGDIDRGGVFAALAGTMLLLAPDERTQIAAFLVNKFRGDPALLGTVFEDLRARAFGVPTLGVVPFLPDLRIADEDAVPLDDSGIAAEASVDIAVVQLPHIANFDEFDALRWQRGVRLRYVRRPDELGRAQVIVLPGTKATISDLAWMRELGWDTAIAQVRQRGVVVVGICGGYQLLGDELSDPEGLEGAKDGRAQGLRLLPLCTRFAGDKQTHQVRVRLADGAELCGYEIHLGDTSVGLGATPFAEIIERGGQRVQVADGAVSDDGKVWGTYVHGLFADDAFRRRFLLQLGWREDGAAVAVEAEYDRLADAVEEAVSWAELERIVGG